MARAPFDRHLPKADFSLPPKREVMEELARLLETAELRPLIDRSFAFEEIGEAMQRLVSGEGLGRIVLVP